MQSSSCDFPLTEEDIRSVRLSLVDWRNDIIAHAENIPDLSISLKESSSLRVVELCKLNSERYKEHCYTGLVANPGCHVLSRFIFAIGKEFWADKKVIELGCGIGICGLTLALQGSSISEILLTDGEISAVELARQNFSLNQQYISDRVKYNFKQLTWSVEAVKTEGLENQFNVILGADLVYARIDLDALISTCSCLLDISMPGSCIIFCYLPRISNAPDKLEKIAAKHGLRVAFISLSSFLSDESIQIHFWSSVQAAIFVPFSQEFPDIFPEQKAFQSAKAYEEADDEFDLLAIDGLSD